MKFFKENSNKIVELLNTNFDVASSPLIGHIHIDESISSRLDSIMKFTFELRNVSEYLEVNVYEPSEKKHQSRYNLKCRDSALFFTEKSDASNIQEINCEFKKPKFGKWTFEIINPINQIVNLHLKAFVFFHDFVDDTSYYSNYYDRDDYRRKKFKRQTIENFQSEIRIEAKWSKPILNFPTPQHIHVSLSKGLKPILNATVQAVIYRPSGDYVTIKLHDNGLNADRFKDDGIYTRDFSNFDLNGTYYGRVGFFNSGREQLSILFSS